MLILGIETSCDETSAAVVEDGTKVLSNIIASSSDLHIETGGIVPEVAARKQVESIIPVINKAVGSINGKQRTENGKRKTENREPLADFRPRTPDLDAIAVTIGPGLIGSLLVGVETAKALSFAWNKPIIPVNHLVGHIYGNFVAERSKVNKKIKFPAIVLIVSGGHTDLVLMRAHGKFSWLGGTRDDAAGEAFDKVARMLGLGFPGGPKLEVKASKFKVHPPAGGSRIKIELPRPMIGSGDYDMSFSGLKTAVFNIIRKDPHNIDSHLFVSRLAREFQEAITDVLVEKTFKAARDFKVKSILLAGGVAANKRLREKCVYYAGKTGTPVFIPPVNLCTDNAAYIASAAYFNYNPVPLEKVKADPGLGMR